MSKAWDYNEDRTRIIIDPPKQRLGISGHRLSGVLNLDKYSSPFQVWCEMTKLVKAPFEETKYIIAGRAAEPKIIQYVSERFPNVMSIEEYYGNIFDDYRYNNFKDDSDIFSGVIDAVSVKPDGRTIAMICECKTSSHPEAWANDTIPVEYALQGALYSYLKGLDKVLFACTFLDDMDYAHPENIKVTDENTILRVVNLSDLVFDINGEYLNIEGVMQYAEKFWNDYVLTGVSPEFDEVRDKEYLDIIRATNATKDSSLEDVCKEAYDLYTRIEKIRQDTNLDVLEKRLDNLQKSIKSTMLELDVPTCGKFKISKRITKKFNVENLEDIKPELYTTYCKEKTVVEFDEEQFKKDLPDEYNMFCDEIVSATLTKDKYKEEKEEE